jgi:hypothetical protein
MQRHVSRTLRLAAGAAALVAAAAPALAGVAGTTFAYSTGFDAGVGPEWSLATRQDNGDDGILGRLEDGSARLSLVAPGPGRASLDFDLIGFHGAPPVGCCASPFRLTINGDLVLEASFGSGVPQRTVDTLGAQIDGGGDVRFIAIPSFALKAGANEIVFERGAAQGSAREPWGLDNVSVSGSVTPVPEPHAWALLLAGAGVVALRLRTRRP